MQTGQGKPARLAILKWESEMWINLYNQLSAIEALDNPSLNARGERILNYLRCRSMRVLEAARFAAWQRRVK